jgi:adenylate cyclase class 2
MAIETEQKYRLNRDQADEVIAALNEFGAEFAGEDHEENIIFANDELIARNAVVRVRKIDGRSILTLKMRLPGIGGIKQQVEEETAIADPEAMIRIIEQLGIRRRVVYEKRRRTWKFRSVEVVIDELPFGLYMEIEGAITAIKEAEMLLGIEDLETEYLTYPRLAARYGTLNGDVVEARFK